MVYKRLKKLVVVCVCFWKRVEDVQKIRRICYEKSAGCSSIDGDHLKRDESFLLVKDQRKH